MKIAILLGLCICATFLTGQSAVTARRYEKLLESIQDLPFPESDGIPLPTIYVDGKKRTYTRAILDSFVDTLVGAYKSVVDALGFEVSYKTASGTEVEAKGVVLNKGTDKEELAVVGAFSYGDGETIVTNMWTSGRGGYRAHVVFKNRAVIMPKVIQSLLGG